MSAQRHHHAQTRGLARGWLLVVSLFTAELTAICLAVALGR